ncbi:MAG: cystine transport system substrate-binding protein [Clostridium sp.]|jgi:cystine transport system substrate-binding protein
MRKMLKLFTTVALISIILVGCGAKKEAQKITLLDQIKKSGTMKVGLMGTYPPYNFMNEKNEIDGFDADIAKDVAKRLGVKAEFITNEWSGMVAGLEQSKFDIVISQMTITDERKESMDFTKAYIKNSVNVIVKKDNNNIKSINDFKGKKIGVGLGTNDETYLRNEIIPKVGNFEIITYNDVVTTLLDLNNGRIDATVNNIFAIKPIVDKNNMKIKAVGDPIKEDYAGMAIRKGNPEFLNAVDKALEDMKTDGSYKEIFVKWFGVEPTN